ncbi:MAG TPA: tRNA lysidine(34) synthetase TilS [Candidatus Binataceae bacterium]|nr:tRNA lysidine(34) synthetase TilS [Candidatus Binataceae bacterium]
MERRSIIRRVEREVRSVLTAVPTDRRGLILVALSGGPDSVALLHALLRISVDHPELGYRVAAAHLNHRLRGTESDRDECFVRSLCASAGVPLVVEQASDLNRARSNLEERARELRYDFLNRTADRLGAVLIATAHHADDQAETVMLRLLRGSGAAGLAAMAEIGPDRLIRPLLKVQKPAIITYNSISKAQFITDSSNLVDNFLRNRVRSELLPMLERDYAPGLGRRLGELAGEMRELKDFLTAQARHELTTRVGGDNRLNLAGFWELYPALAAAVLREFLHINLGSLRHIRRVQIEALRRICMTPVESGTRVVALPGGWTFRREYGFATLQGTCGESHAPFAAELAMEGRTVVQAAGFAFFSSVIEAGQPAFPAPPWKPASAMEAYFDAEVVSNLVVRSFATGDRIRVFGRGGRRKVHDVFIDNKLPVTLRSRWPLVVSDGKVAWIPRFARSAMAIVTPSTRKVLHLRAIVPVADAASLSLPAN